MTDIGATLRQARMRASLEIADFEARTRIRAKYLRALEDEEWDLLPGYAYAKAFLRTYADMLGLDGQMLLDEFKRQNPDPAELDLAPVPRPRRDARRARPRVRLRQRAGGGGRGRARGWSRRSSIAVVAVMFVVLVAAGLYAVGKLGGSKSASLTTATHTTTAPSHTHTAPRRTSVPGRVSLQLVPTGSVWVCLVGYRTTANSHAHLRINGLLTPASPRPVYYAENHFLVTFGNHLIRMLIDGHSHTVPATPTVVVSYEIRPGGGYRKVTASAAPHCA
jgi:cytoskeleton protein RodZ